MSTTSIEISVSEVSRAAMDGVTSEVTVDTQMPAVTFDVSRTPPLNAFTSVPQDIVGDNTVNVLTGLNYAIGVVGIIGNLLVVIVMLASPSMRKRMANIFITNQSCIDGMAAVFLVATTTISSDEVPYGGTHGAIYCKLWLSKVTLWGLLVSSTYNLMSLTLERYLAVVHPIWHKVFFTRTKAAVMLIFPWMFGIVYNCSYMIPTCVVVDGMCIKYSQWPSDTVRKAFGILTVVIQYFVPLALQFFCYGRILLVIKQKAKVKPAVTPSSNAALNSQATAQSQSNPQSLAVPPTAGVGQPPQKASEDRWSRAHKNTLKTAALVSLSFVLCWSWNQVIYTMFNLGFPEDYNSPFYMFTVIAVFMNCCINPFIYSLQYEQFKKAAKQLFFKTTGHDHLDSSVNTAMALS